MKRILFLVTNWRSANGICADAVMRSLVADGHEVHCIIGREQADPTAPLTSPEPAFSVDGVKYHTVTPPSLSNKLYAKARGKSGIGAKLLRLTAKLLNKAQLLLSYPTWPLISRGYARRLYKKADAVVREHGIDTVVPIYTAMETLVAADRLKREQPSIRLIPYFLDGLSAGHGPRCFSPEWTVRRGFKWEARLLPRADKVIMMRSAEGHYEGRSESDGYIGKVRFLDLPLFDPSLAAAAECDLLPIGKINLVYVGSIPAHIRHPRYLVELFSAIEDERLCLTFIGSSTCPEYLTAAANADPRIRVLPPVDHDTALRAMNAADILVNLGNNITGMTPCKIFEYMSVGLPIISTAPIKNEPGLVYLDRYPSRLVLDESGDREAAKRELRSFIEREAGKRVDSVALGELFPENAPAATAREII